VKTTIDIPDDMLEDAMRFTRAKTKREAVVTAVNTFNRMHRLRELNARLRGTFVDFMTQEDLWKLRQDAR